MDGIKSEHLSTIAGSTEAGAAWEIYLEARRAQIRRELEDEPKESPDDLKEDWRFKLGMVVMCSELLTLREETAKEIDKLED